jgi:hypothetical protein
MNHGLILGGLKGNSTGRATGAHRIATVLRQHSWDIEVLDFVTSWSQEQLKQYLDTRINKNTKFIAYSFTFHTWEDRFQEIFDYARKKNPDIKVIVGGMATEICPIIADYYVNGYGEVAVLEVVKDIVGNSPFLKHTIHPRTGGKMIKAMDAYPAFPLTTLNPEVIYQKRDFIHSKEALITEIARGCKFKCSYCTYPILGVKGDVTRSAESYYEELTRNYNEWGTTNYEISDETFNDRTEKIEKFANVTQKLDFQPNLTGFIRADLLAARRQDWPLLHGMNFWGHWYGVESFNHESAKSIGKGMHPDKIKEGLIDCRKYFESKGYYKGTVSMIIGLPGETEDTVKDAWKWFHTHWKGMAPIYYALYIPKSDVTDETSSYSQDWKTKGFDEYHGIPPQWEPQYTGMYGAGTYWKEGLTNGVIWDNGNLNFYKAHQMVDEWYKDYGKTFSAHSFNLIDIPFAFDSFDQWLYKPLNEIHDIRNAAQDRHIEEYIEKKLNWTP